MASRTDIINMALLLIGQEMISSEDEGSKTSDVASALLDLCIETAISEDDWSFAKKRVKLSPLSETPLFGYDNGFLLPSDYNHIYIEEGDEFDFREEGNVIYANVDTLDMIYIANIEDLNLFKPKFTDAVVTLLAAKIAYAISGSTSLPAQLEQLYEKRLAKARAENTRGYGLIPETDTWIEDR